VAHEQDGAAGAGDLVHLAQALALELEVAHGQDLVDEEDLRVEVRGHREGQAHVHAARVALDRRVDEGLHAREGHDLVELPVDLPLAHPEDGAVQVDVLAPRESP